MGGHGGSQKPPEHLRTSAWMSEDALRLLKRDLDVARRRGGVWGAWSRWHALTLPGIDPHSYLAGIAGCQAWNEGLR